VSSSFDDPAGATTDWQRRPTIATHEDATSFEPGIATLLDRHAPNTEDASSE
jgi:hypothetical protein